MNFIKKTLALCSFATAATAVAGLVDHPEFLEFPNVNVDAHIRIIGRKYFPFIRETLDPEAGLPFLKAIKHDAAKAAIAAGMTKEEAEKYAKKMADAAYNFELLPAPKPELLEFELYLRGRQELYCRNKNSTEMPPSWKKLMALHREQRRYNTIRAYYYLVRFLIHRESFECKDIIAKMFEEKNSGCLDTQNVLYNAVRPEFLWHDAKFANESKKIIFDYLRFFAATSKAEKEWRYINSYDMMKWAFFRGDRFFSGKTQNPIMAVLYNRYNNSFSDLQRLCYDPMLRDVIIAIGLTNHQMRAARTIAEEYAEQSEINYPILALRSDYATAVRLLKDKKEHAALLAQLEIKTLNGRAKISAIDAYIKKFPDYTPKDMPNTSIALLTHMELNAIAGTELLLLGDAKGAMKYYMSGCTGEDIAIIAEKIFSIEELIAFCKDNNITPVDKDLEIYSAQCAKETQSRYPNFITPEQRNYLLRNLLARRLMRAGRFEEAKKYFTGPRLIALAQRYFALRAAADNSAAAKAERFNAFLNLAALIRFEGKKLFGTMLEPDNLICNDDYKCVWGKRLLESGILKKTTAKRHTNRFKAAELYAEAAKYTDDKTQKGYCYFVAGIILRGLDDVAADKYFKLLYHTCPQLTRNNWFKGFHEVPGIVRMWYRAKLFAPGGIDKMAVKLPMPQIRAAEIPAATPVAKIFADAAKAERQHDINTMLSLCMAAVKRGDIRGYIPMIAWYCNLEDHQTTVVLTTEYFAKGGKENAIRFCHALACWKLGLGDHATAALLQIINSEKENMELLKLANANYVMMMENLNSKTIDPQAMKDFHQKLDKLNENFLYLEDVFTDFDFPGVPRDEKIKK